MSPEQRERANTHKRLGRVQEKLESYIHLMLITHMDQSGIYYWNLLPLVPDSVWHGSDSKPGIALLVQRIKVGAAGGCDLSAAFLAKWEEAFELCDYWRHQRPPARSASFKAQESAWEKEDDDWEDLEKHLDP